MNLTPVRDKLDLDRSLFLNEHGHVLEFNNSSEYFPVAFMTRCCTAAVSADERGIYCKKCFHVTDPMLGGIPEKGLDY